MDARRARIPTGRFQRVLLLAALVVLAAVPRLAMSSLRPVLCTDAVFFLERAAALERGDFEAALSRLELNPYLFALVAVHRVGLDWEAAGRVLSLTFAALAVLPLFDLTRRLFGESVAVVACVLYAVQPELIEWSPEIIRDPLFWFLFLSSLLASYRAATGGRIVMYVLAGASVALAGLTRFEGWFLVVPLALWSVLARPREIGRRAVTFRLGLALAMTPVLLVVANLTLLAGYDRWEWGRFDHLALVHAWTHGQAAESPLVASDDRATQDTVRAARPNFRAMCWGMAHTFVRGVHPVYLALIATGLLAARRTAFWRVHAPLLLLAGLNLLAVWIYFWNQHEINARYMLLVLLVGLPYSGLGLCAFVERIARATNLRAYSPRARVAAAALALMVVATIGCGDALSSGYQSRFLKADLGRWIRVRFGAERLLLCSENLERLVGYYARGRHASFPSGVGGAEAVRRVEDVQPDVVVLWLKPPGDRLLADVLAEHRRLGYVLYGGAELPSSCDDAAVLVREAIARRSAPARTGVSRVSLSDRAPTLY